MGNFQVTDRRTAATSLEIVRMLDFEILKHNGPSFRV